MNVAHVIIRMNGINVECHPVFYFSTEHHHIIVYEIKHEGVSVVVPYYTIHYNDISFRDVTFLLPFTCFTRKKQLDDIPTCPYVPDLPDGSPVPYQYMNHLDMHEFQSELYVKYIQVNPDERKADQTKLEKLMDIINVPESERAFHGLIEHFGDRSQERDILDIARYLVDVIDEGITSIFPKLKNLLDFIIGTSLLPFDGERPHQEQVPFFYQFAQGHHRDRFIDLLVEHVVEVREQLGVTQMPVNLPPVSITMDEFNRLPFIKGTCANPIHSQHLIDITQRLFDEYKKITPPFLLDSPNSYVDMLEEKEYGDTHPICMSLRDHILQKGIHVTQNEIKQLKKIYPEHDFTFIHDTYMRHVNDYFDKVVAQLYNEYLLPLRKDPDAVLARISEKPHPASRASFVFDNGLFNHFYFYKRQFELGYMIIDPDKEFILEQVLDKREELGSPGAMGIPYKIGRYYLKELESPNRDFFIMPNTSTKKTLMRVPNHILEVMIGTILSAYIDVSCTPSFMNTFASIVLPEKSYTFYELLTPMDKNRLGHVETDHFVLDLHSFAIFQILFGLHNAQETCHFVHNDLHKGNMMLRKHTEYRRVKYQITDTLFLYGHVDRDAVIIDYGLARVETQKHVITNSDDDILNQMDSTQRYEYNPYIDVAAFLLYNYNFSDEDTYPIFADLLILFFHLHPDDDLDDFIETHSLQVGKWRMNSYRLKQLKTPPLSALALIQHLHLEVITDRDAILGLGQNKICFSQLDIDDPSFIVYKNVNLQTAKKVMGGDKRSRYVPHALPESLPSDQAIYPIQEYEITYEGMPFHLSMTSQYDPTPLAFSHQLPIKQRVFGQKTMFLMRIDPKAAGFQFDLNCCHLDTLSYLDTDAIESGVCINAGFFNIHTDYSSIGDIKIRGSKLPFSKIPKEYTAYYHQVVVSTTIWINPIASDIKHNFVLPYFFSGPLLIRDGDIVFTEDTLDIKNDQGVHIFRCENSSRKKKFINRGPDPQKEPENVLVKNCNTPPSLPGELFHAANRNPRSALVTTKDDQVYFVTSAGRFDGNDGMTLPEFARYLSKIPNVRSAINLDGGRSSRMSVKTSLSSDILYTPSSSEASPYPVGSILSFVKKVPDARDLITARPSTLVEPQPASTAASGTVESSLNPSQHILIKVMDDYGKELYYKLLPTTRLEKVFKDYSEREGKMQTSLRFVFNGRIVLPYQTPLELNMKKKDAIIAVPKHSLDKPMTNIEAREMVHFRGSKKKRRSRRHRSKRQG
jgi:small ubiquitin-related modifier